MNWRQHLKPDLGDLRVERVLRVVDDNQPAKIINGELICLYPVENMAQTIVNLTKNDLIEQKRLLRLYCPKYNPITHFEALALRWEVKVGLLESQGVPVQLAEIQVAQEMQLLAFMDELLPL